MAQRRTLKDAQFRILGHLDTETNGRQILKDAQFRTLGYYEPSGDLTKDARYRIVGRGNILTSLLGAR